MLLQQRKLPEKLFSFGQMGGNLLFTLVTNKGEHSIIYSM